MGDSLIAVVVIALVAILMFVFPVMTMSDRTDDISKLTVQTEVTEFVDDVRTTGKLTLGKYNKLVESVAATGNSYDVDMTLKLLDENPGKKTTQAQSSAIGENATMELYTSQILDQLSNSKTKSLALKEGDYFSVSVKNTNVTTSQQFKNFLYKVTGNNNYTITAEHSGLVTANGTGK